jgi:hypothetical protein
MVLLLRSWGLGVIALAPPVEADPEIHLGLGLFSVDVEQFNRSDQTAMYFHRDGEGRLLALDFLARASGNPELPVNGLLWASAVRS